MHGVCVAILVVEPTVGEDRTQGFAASTARCCNHFNDALNLLMFSFHLTRGWEVDTAARVPSTGDRLDWKLSVSFPAIVVF